MEHPTSFFTTSPDEPRRLFWALRQSVASLKPIPSDSQHAAGSLSALSKTWFHMSSPSTLPCRAPRAHRKAGDIGAPSKLSPPLRSQDSRRREQLDSGRTPFCNKALSTSSCLMQSKAPSTSAENLSQRCRDTGCGSPRFIAQMFVSCDFLSRLTAVCKARM